MLSFLPSLCQVVRFIETLVRMDNRSIDQELMAEVMVVLLCLQALMCFSPTRCPWNRRFSSRDSG